MGTLSIRLPEDKRQRLREDKTEPSALRDEEYSGD